jgi:hypothetical protein
MAVSSYALTSLANLKEYLGITGTADDAILEKCIDRASVRMETYCNRLLKARDHAEWRSGSGVSEIRLYQYPCSQVIGVWTGAYAALVIGQGDATDIRASISINQETGSPAAVLTRTTSAGVTTTTTLAFATYPTTAALATAIGSTAGFTCTLGKNIRTAQLRPRAAGDVVLATVTLFAADTPSEYTYDPDTATLAIDQSWWAYWPLERGIMPDAVKSVCIEYRAGYETIPDDMEQCCLEVTSMLFRDRKRDKSLITERLGDYSYSRASPSGDVMGSSILAIMEEYLLEYREFS